MSENTKHNIAVVILAAGEGTRMKSDLPKVLHELHGKPLVAHVVDNVLASRVTDAPFVVVSPKHTLVQEVLGKKAHYVVQQEQLGTGHAAATARALVEGNAAHVIVLYGDMPFLQPDSIAALAATHIQEKNTVTLMTVQADFSAGTASPLYDFGRIIRNTAGDIIDSIELRDCTGEQAAITEVNPCYYCFDAAWLWEHTAKLTNTNAQGEYYLTDLVKMAIQESKQLGSMHIPVGEAIGINSKEDLTRAHTI